MPTDFFISYTSADRAWAEWVGWVLEEQGATVVLQAWDFVPGSNFALEMQRAAESAQRTIAILSPDYLTSRFAAPEWATAFARDPDGLNRALIPIRVRLCALEGLLKTIVHIDLVDVDEPTARRRILDGVFAQRAKPAQPPAFPGISDGATTVKAFPGPTPDQASAAPYVPRIRRTTTDVDRTRFIKAAFAEIRDCFERGLEALRDQPRVDTEYTPVSQTEFLAQIYTDGQQRAGCRIWLGGMMGGNEIGYYEGRDFNARNNALNEVLAISHDPHELALSAIMKMISWKRGIEGSINLDHMNSEQAADYLWRRFVSALE